MGCLYQISFPNGKSYIGISSTTAEKRFAAHRAKRSKSVVSHALRKYGASSVKLRTLVVANDWKYLCDLERRAIAAYGTKIPAGYNVTEGGDGALGYSHTKEHLDKIRGVVPKGMAGYKFTDADKEKIAAAGRGKKRSPETKAKIGEANKHREWTEESRAKASASHKGKVPPNKGVPMAAEQKAKISASKKAARITLTPEHKEKIGAASAARKGIKWSAESIAKRKATMAAKKEAQRGGA